MRLGWLVGWAQGDGLGLGEFGSAHRTGVGWEVPTVRFFWIGSGWGEIGVK